MCIVIIAQVYCSSVFCSVAFSSICEKKVPEPTNAATSVGFGPHNGSADAFFPAQGSFGLTGTQSGASTATTSVVSGASGTGSTELFDQPPTMNASDGAFDLSDITGARESAVVSLELLASSLMLVIQFDSVSTAANW